MQTDKRLIDANALLDAMRDEEFQTFVPLDEIDSVIDNAPTIDAVPVVHGKWLPTSIDPVDPYFRCSVCHYGTDTIFDGGDEPFKYCPNCGAKMDGGAE